MKGLVIKINTKSGPLNYIKVRKFKTLHEAHHRLRIKQVIYGEIFTYYCEGMDFSRSTILIDNRI